MFRASGSVATSDGSRLTLITGIQVRFLSLVWIGDVSGDAIIVHSRRNLVTTYVMVIRTPSPNQVVMWLVLLASPVVVQV